MTSISPSIAQRARTVGFLRLLPFRHGCATVCAPLVAEGLAKPGNLIDEMSHAKGGTPNQIALAWVLKRSAVMLPIFRTSRVSHLEENVAGASITLSDEEFTMLDAASLAA